MQKLRDSLTDSVDLQYSVCSAHYRLRPAAPTPAGQSTMTREQRKAQARAEQKAGKMTPAGEGPGTK